MKKRITSLLLVAAMLASMVILPVSAEGAEGAKTPGTYAAREVCPHCSEAIGDIAWTDLAGGEVSSAVNLTADGHYRLTGDLTVTNGHGINLPNGTSTSKPNVVLDLNGHSITASKRAIMVGKYNTFTVMDTVGGSTVKGLTATMGGTAVYAYDYTTVNMYDITANASDSTTGSGGAIYVSTSATFNMYSGVVNGTVNTASNKMGGTVYVNGATFNLYDGTVNTGSVPNGNGDCMYAAGTSTLNFRGGTVNGEVTVTTTSTVNLSGTPVLDNLDLSSGVAANVGELEDGASVAVTADAGTAFTQEFADATTAESYKSFIKPALNYRTVEVTASNALALSEIICPHCGKTESQLTAEGDAWQAWDSATATGSTNPVTLSGHYYLTGDISHSGAYFVGVNTAGAQASPDLAIDLRGYSLVSTNNRVAYVRKGTGETVLSFMDSVGGGELKGKYTSATTTAPGGVFYNEATLQFWDVKVTDYATTRTGVGGAINTSGDLNIVRSTVSGVAATSGGAIGTSGAAKVTIKDSTINGGTCTGDGGAIYSTTGSITIENSTVVDGTATHGGSIYFTGAGSLRVTDSTIGEVGAAAALNTLKLSGKTTISSLDLTNGSVADASDLTAGSAVTVIAADNTPFTTDLATPEDFVSYFSSGVDGKIVTVVGSALALAAPPAEPLTYYCPHCDQDVEWTPWTAEGGVKITASGHYYLEESASIGSQCYAGSSNDDTAKTAVNVILDLHGKSITSTVRVFQVYPYSTLTLLDTVGNSELSGKGANNDHGGVIVLRPNANLRILSGTYTANPKTTLRSGGVIYAGENSTIEVTGGTLDASAYDNASYFGGAIYTNIGSTVTLRDCKIIGGKAKQGGSVYTTGTDLIISGTTTVTGGTAENGGNIYCTYSAAKEKGSLLISDSAEISGGQAVNGGNVFAPSGAAVTMTGGTVKDGIAAYSAESALESQGRGGNLYLGGGAHSITGGTVTGGTSAADNAMFGGGNIYLLSGGSLELGGTAVVSNGESSTSGGDIFIGGVSTAKGTLSIASTVSGTLNIGTEDGKSLYGQTFPNATCESTDVVFKLDGNCGNAAITRQDDNTLVVAGGGLVLVGTDGKAQFYGDPAAAVSAYTGGYMLVAGADEVALSGGSYVIDLNGYSNVAVTGTGTMLGFDSNNAASGYQTSAQVMVDPAVTVSNTLVTTAPDGRQYVKVQDGNTYSFHAFDLSVKSVSIAPNADSSSMYYKGVWNGDDILKNNAIESFGIVVSVKDLPGEDFRTEVEGTIDGEPANYNRYSEFRAADFANGVVKTGVEITEIMKTDLTNEANAYRGSQIKIYAAAYYTFSDGTETVTVTVPVVNDGYSLYDVMNLIDNNDTTYNALQAKIDPFYTTWKNSMDLWFSGYTYNETAYEGLTDTFTNIKAVTTPAEV